MHHQSVRGFPKDSPKKKDFIMIFGVGWEGLQRTHASHTPDAF